MTDRPLEVCILAAGVGSRMRSNKAKVLQTLAGRPLLAHLLDTVGGLQPARIHIVIGQDAENVQQTFADQEGVNWVLQAQRLGTGHAVAQVIPHLMKDSRLLILLGDAPLVSLSTLQALMALPADLTVLSVNMPNPFGYGRIVRDGGQVTCIVEEKDAEASVKLITEINTGVMIAESEPLAMWLDQLDNSNAQQEYLLTDIVKHARNGNYNVKAHCSEDPVEVSGINTFVQLAALERRMQKKHAEDLMLQGVQILDPHRFDLRGTVETGQGVVIDVNVILEGDVILGNNVTIGSNVMIKDCTIGDGTVIKANSVLEGASVGPNCSVGPFARLRPGAELMESVGIGNFVEVKKTKLGIGSKASHLAYLGDAVIGNEVNIGAGTITCNYDGVNKHETRIGDGAFIGSNSALVAPVSIGARSTIGAGSTITKDVDPEVLALARGKQKSIAGWQRPVKKKT